MNEFDKAMRILKRTGNISRFPVSNTSRRKNVLVSGDDSAQWSLVIKGAVAAGKTVIVSTLGEADQILSVLDGLCTYTVISDEGSAPYNPFTQSESVISEMLMSICGQTSPGVRVLVRIVAQIAALDKYLIPTLARDFVTNETFEKSLNSLVNARKLSPNQKESFLEKLHSYSSYYMELDSVLGDLPRFVRNAGGGRGFRSDSSLSALVSRYDAVVFLLQGNLSLRNTDKTMLKLFSLDVDKISRNGISLVLGDLCYQYQQYFAHIYDVSAANVFLHLRSTADYTDNRMYKQLIKSKFDIYCIFSHYNTDMCAFWSDTIAQGEVADFTYSNSDANEVALHSGLFQHPMHHRQNASSVSVHFADKNLIKPYDIRNLPRYECIFLDKESRRIMKCSIL